MNVDDQKKPLRKRDYTTEVWAGDLNDYVCVCLQRNSFVYLARDLRRVQPSKSSLCRTLKTILTFRMKWTVFDNEKTKTKKLKKERHCICFLSDKLWIN